MTTKPLRILLIEDSPADAEFVLELFRDQEEIFRLDRVERLGEALQALERERYDAVLSDLGLPDCRGLETFSRLHARCDAVPIVILTGMDDEAVAVEALRSGAQDYLIKGSMDASIIQRSLLYAIERRRLQTGSIDGAIYGLMVEDSNEDAEYIEETLVDIAFLRMNWRRAETLAGALAALDESLPDVVLLDLILPDSSGLSTFTCLHAAHPDLPVIVLTVMGDEVLAVKAVREGAQDFLTKGRFDAVFLARRIRFAVERNRSERERFRRRKEAFLREQNEKLRKALGATVQAIAAVVEIRDPYTAGHQKRVARLSRAIAREMGVDGEIMEGIRIAAEIHDLGKISVPAEILSKPTRLSESEFSLIKGHPEAGYDILKQIDFFWPVAEIVRQHHERPDGSGYPAGLKGEEIRMEARILSVADVVEAMASHRPYRPALGIETALAEIEKSRGILYDAAVADVCVRLFREKGFVLGA